MKIKLIGLISLMILLLATSYFLFNAYLNYERAGIFKTTINNNIYLHKALMEIEKERGTTALYLASKNRDYQKLMLRQRKKTDKAIKRLRANIVTDQKTILSFIESYKESNSLDTLMYQRMLNQLNRLIRIRKLVDNGQGGLNSIILDKYSNKITKSILQNLRQSNRFILDLNIKDLNSILDNLYISQEYTGLNRDYLAYTLEKKKPLTEKEITTWSEFYGKSLQYNPSLITNNEFKQEALEIFRRYHVKDIDKKIAHYNIDIIKHSKTGKYEVSPLDWFTVFTKKMNVYSKSVELFNQKSIEAINNYLSNVYLVIGASILLVLL
jgi:methyl-accepting chemotaxis protein